MAATPRFKVHNPAGEYVASCKHAEDAAMIVGNYGDGAKIKDRDFGIVVWHEGHEDFPAAESWDGARIKIFERILDASNRAKARYEARHGVKL